MQYTIHTLNVLLDDLKERRISKEDAAYRISNFLFDHDFMLEIYRPETLGINPTEIKEDSDTMYVLINRPRALKCLANAIINDGFDKYDRNTAAWLNTIVTAGILASAQREKRLNDDVANGEIDRAKAERERDSIEEFNAALNKVIRVARKIVNSQAKKMAQETGLPKELCSTILYQAPEPEMISNFKIGFYTVKALMVIYKYVERVPANAREPIEDINWAPMFARLFGEKNITEACLFILLEGSNHLSNFKSPDVKRIWDSLTMFALTRLEKVPSETQHQMMDLYLKRIQRMFRNNSFDLRVDMRKLDPEKMPRLTALINDDKYDYKGKITAIVKDIVKDDKDDDDDDD